MYWYEISYLWILLIPLVPSIKNDGRWAENPRFYPKIHCKKHWFWAKIELQIQGRNLKSQKLRWKLPILDNFELNLLENRELFLQIQVVKGYSLCSFKPLIHLCWQGSKTPPAEENSLRRENDVRKENGLYLRPYYYND